MKNKVIFDDYGSYGMFIDRMWAAGNRNYD